MTLKGVCAALVTLLVCGLAGAADNALLIQVEPGGGYRVWHTEGTTQLEEDEILTVAATAMPEGGEYHEVSAGAARAIQTRQGVVIELRDAATDPRLLIDRDECGAIKLWHSEGTTQLTEEQIADLVISALPGGGRPVKVDGNYAKAFITELGYAVVIWQPVRR